MSRRIMPSCSLRTGKLRKVLKRGGQLQNLLLRYSLALLNQVSQTAACNRNHNLGERLARCLLLCHDRVEVDELIPDWRRKRGLEYKL